MERQIGTTQLGRSLTEAGPKRRWRARTPKPCGHGAAPGQRKAFWSACAPAPLFHSRQMFSCSTASSLLNQRAHDRLGAQVIHQRLRAEDAAAQAAEIAAAVRYPQREKIVRVDPTVARHQAFRHA